MIIQINFKHFFESPVENKFEHNMSSINGMNFVEMSYCSRKIKLLLDSEASINAIFSNTLHSNQNVNL